MFNGSIRNSPTDHDGRFTDTALHRVAHRTGVVRSRRATSVVVIAVMMAVQPHRDRRCRAALMREPWQPVFSNINAVSERVPSGTVGELQVAEVGSKSQTDP